MRSSYADISLLCMDTRRSIDPTWEGGVIECLRNATFGLFLSCCSLYSSPLLIHLRSKHKFAWNWKRPFDAGALRAIRACQLILDSLGPTPQSFTRVTESRMRLSSTSLYFSLVLLVPFVSAAFDPSRNDNLAVYYGQNSYGASHPTDTAGFQGNLSEYCQDSTIDAFPLAFMNVFFSTGDLPEINLANTCNNNDNPVFQGSSLPNCQFMSDDIKACQAKGKIVTLSMGGATGAATFTSDAQAESFAELVWDLFLGGSSDTRPFGDAVLDGVDLDIEGGGSTGYAAFVTRIRSLADGASKPYYVTAAPQCPFPDGNLGDVLNAVGFDAVYVQFYNNFCGLNNFDNPNAWNFATWDSWARETSPNPDVKIYIGAPAAPTAAGSGYVEPDKITSILKETQANFTSFGGAMLWDASQAQGNDRYDQVVKSAMTGGTAAKTHKESKPSFYTQPSRFFRF
ncbi:hypothetical protein D9758_000802 [Tetrapyrgos nigripes]|uniref:chitinase n=1 Tax=Tetrapyrgos nigripes TaxID=182062 RepID=A0A8H5GZB4_9AGAR|nr:hypothetical protein D9758_000802 [Tetrapyrgos nigripes]